MNMFESWVDLDLNPILSFSSSGKIKFFNSEAQFLLDRIKPNELFDLAIKYAPKSFGSQTSYVDLTLKNYTFYAITVMYEDEDELHLKLYKSASVKRNSNLHIKNLNLTNLFTLMDLAISTNKIKSKTAFIKNYDPSIPEFKLNATIFMKILNQIFELFEDCEEINCSIFLKMGEYIKIDNKKYTLVCTEISSKFIEKVSKIKVDDGSVLLNYEDNKISIDLPLIL